MIYIILFLLCGIFFEIKDKLTISSKWCLKNFTAFTKTATWQAKIIENILLT